MRLRTFDELKNTVDASGSDLAKMELEWLLKLARTNFAACYGTGMHGPDGHDAAIVAISGRVPPIAGCGQYLEQVCDWLYAQAEEKCTCGAPEFITGCDHKRVPGDGTDRCVCRPKECPWTIRTGVFL